MHILCNRKEQKCKSNKAILGGTSKLPLGGITICSKGYTLFLLTSGEHRAPKHSFELPQKQSKPNSEPFLHFLGNKDTKQHQDIEGGHRPQASHRGRPPATCHLSQSLAGHLPTTDGNSVLFGNFSLGFLNTSQDSSFPHTYTSEIVLPLFLGAPSQILISTLFSSFSPF